jgi:hypothetical protein
MRALLSRTFLSRSATAAAALLAGAVTLLAGPLPAYAATVFIEVIPSTVMAGSSVSLRASCGTSLEPAKATSEAFGTVTLIAENNFLVGTAMVPPHKAPAGYSIRLSCMTGDRATTTLWVVGRAALPTRGPNTGGGYLSQRGPGGTLLIGGGLAAVGVGTVLAVWAVRRRRAGNL